MTSVSTSQKDRSFWRCTKEREHRSNNVMYISWPKLAFCLVIDKFQPCTLFWTSYFVSLALSLFFRTNYNSSHWNPRLFYFASISGKTKLCDLENQVPELDMTELWHTYAKVSCSLLISLYFIRLICNLSLVHLILKYIPYNQNSLSAFW